MSRHDEREIQAKAMAQILDPFIKRLEALEQNAPELAPVFEATANIIEELKALQGTVEELREENQTLRFLKDNPPTDGTDGKDGRDGDDGTDGRDGTGIAELMIDQDGVLVATLTDGNVKRVGRVVGKDGKDGRDGNDGEPGTDGKDGNDGEPGTDGKDGNDGEPGTDGKDGKDGADGLGFEDMDIAYDGERTFTLVFTRGEKRLERAFAVPALIDQGVWKAGSYHPGDVVTQGGSLWIARRDTRKKPGNDNDDWRLSVKRGRDGRDGKDGEGGDES